MTYNIRGGLGMDGKRDTDRIAHTVAEHHPDIVCFQEVHRRLPQSHWVDQPGRLGRGLGMTFTFQANLKSLIGGYGLGIASVSPVVSVRRRRLPGSGEPRGVLEVVLETSDGRVTVFCTHWGLNAAERAAQAEQTAEWVRRASGPVILCGDLNERPEADYVQVLLARTALKDAGADSALPTYPADVPRARIDVLFYSPGLRLTNLTVADSRASDHYPVLADFEPTVSG